jgi:hypothetical protein
MGGLEREGVFMLALDLFYTTFLSQGTDVFTVHEETTTAAVEEDSSCCGGYRGGDKDVRDWKVGGDTGGVGKGIKA